MIKTVIVDDDSLVHVTLRSLADWEKCGYTIVCGCSGGAEAVRYISENPVDLLITDIKMPEVSGLELMRRLREKAAMPLTIVLSGYDEFELVREAFILGAYDYLLKPNINGSSLTQLLNGLRETVFNRIGVAPTSDVNENSLTELEAGDYIAAVFTVTDFSNTARRFGGNLRERMEKPMLELVRQIRRIQGRAEIRAKSPSRYDLYYKVKDKSSDRDTILSVIRQIQGVWHDFMNINTEVGVSDIIPVSELESSLPLCVALCKLSVLIGINGVCCEWKYGAFARAYEEYAEDCDGLIAALCGEDAALLDAETGKWLNGLTALEDEKHARRVIVFLARMADRIENYGMSFFDIFPEGTSLIKITSSFEAPREREIWLRNTIRRVYTYCAENRREKQKTDIQRAKDFMKDNFTNPELTLKTVADFVGFNEKYFSTRFTKECGCTFITYLNELRIKRAQELLLHTNMKIYEISDAVGYVSVEHFNHMFKKKLCISPRDYRQSEK